MFKRIAFILLTVNLLISKPETEDNPSKEGLSFVKAATWCGVSVGAIAAVAGAVVYAPVVMPVVVAGTKATVTGAVAGAKAIGAKAVAAPIAIKLSVAIDAGRAARKFAYSNADEKLEIALKNEFCEHSKAKLDFEKCLDSYNVSNGSNYLDIPRACEEAAMLLVMLEQEKLFQSKNRPTF